MILKSWTILSISNCFVMVGLLSDYDQPLEDSSNAVIQQAEDKEQVIAAGEDYQQMVEGVLHFFTW